MLSLGTARALKEAGLVWSPAQFDFFTIPERGMDERVFVISDMPAGLSQILGQPVVAFEGAGEWALDYVARGEVVWLPTEDQLRGLLAARFAGEPGRLLTLSTRAGWCRCEIELDGQPLVFEAADGGQAYGDALLHVLRQP